MEDKIKEYERLSKEVQELKIRKKAGESQLEMLREDRKKLDDKCRQQFGIEPDELKLKVSELESEIEHKITELKEVLEK